MACSSRKQVAKKVSQKKHLEPWAQKYIEFELPESWQVSFVKFRCCFCGLLRPKTGIEKSKPRKNIWSLGPKNILNLNCLNLGRSRLENSVVFSVACCGRKQVSKKVNQEKTSGALAPKIYCILIA